MQRRVVPAKRGRCSVNGVRGAHGVDECVDAVARLRPRLVAERVISLLAVAIVQLVAPPVSGLPGQLAGAGDHRLDELFVDLAAVALNVGNVAPYRRIVCRFSLLKASENTKCVLKPSAAHTKPSEMPVVPRCIPPPCRRREPIIG